MYNVYKLVNFARNNMTQEELKAIRCTPIEKLIAEDFGELGTPERTEFELRCDAFIIGEQLKSERIKQGLTQDELANRHGLAAHSSLITNAAQTTVNQAYTRVTSDI